MSHRKPGRTFWILTFAIGALSPRKGENRINSRMQEIHQENQCLHVVNESLAYENRHLRRELLRVEGENNLFRSQDDINTQTQPATRPDDAIESTMPVPVLTRPQDTGPIVMETIPENPAALSSDRHTKTR